MIVLNLADITKIYGSGHTQVTAVNNVNLKVKKGEVILIMGPSGSGKTTLLSIAGGILKPTKGRVIIDHTDITDLSEDKLPQLRIKNIGFIFQSFNLLSALTALENVEIALNLAGEKGTSAKLKAKEILVELGLEKRMFDIPANLSGGEKQKVAIGRALINEPKIIMADEPTANLDSKIGHEVSQLLKKEAKKRNKSVIIVSHDARIRDIADRILWFEDGRFKDHTLEMS